MSAAVWYLAGLLCGLLVAAILWYLQRQRWQQHVSELENHLQQHNFELQITLNELAETNQQLKQQTMLDSLSGIFNRLFFDTTLQAELRRSRREHRPLALLLLDLDHFKQINDNYGHLTGDQVIRAAADRISQHLKRGTEKLCRYGGEEFAIILPNTDIQGAYSLAEQIRQDLAQTTLLPQQPHLQVHASIGCYAAITADEHYDSQLYIARADQALYEAKAAGRNKVKTYPDNEPVHSGANHVL